MSVWGAAPPKESDKNDRPEQLYLIDRQVLYGNPGRQDVWDQLDEVITTPYVNEDGIEMKIESTAIDSGGHFTEEVYRFCKNRSALGVVPIKGVDKLKGDVMIGKPNKVEYGAKGNVLKSSIKLYICVDFPVFGPPSKMMGLILDTFYLKYASIFLVEL